MGETHAEGFEHYALTADSVEENAAFLFGDGGELGD